VGVGVGVARPHGGLRLGRAAVATASGSRREKGGGDDDDDASTTNPQHTDEAISISISIASSSSLFSSRR
jgi:hypothetical protein